MANYCRLLTTTPDRGYGLAVAAHRERLKRAAADKVPWTGLCIVNTPLAQCEKLLNIVGIEKVADEKAPTRTLDKSGSGGGGKTEPASPRLG